MESNVLLLCVSLIIPVFFVIYGAVLYKKDVPFLSPYGFITVMTKLGPEVWEFGNKKFGLRLMLLGVAEMIVCVLMIVSCVLDPPSQSVWVILLITCPLELFGFVIPAAQTGKLIDKRFDKNGKRKDI